MLRGSNKLTNATTLLSTSAFSYKRVNKNNYSIILSQHQNINSWKKCCINMIGRYKTVWQIILSSPDWIKALRHSCKRSQAFWVWLSAQCLCWWAGEWLWGTRISWVCPLLSHTQQPLCSSDFHRLQALWTFIAGFKMCITHSNFSSYGYLNILLK